MILRNLRFLKVVKAAKAVAGGAAGASASIIVRPGRPNGSATVAERLRNNLPEVSAADITRHESWYRLRGLYMTKKNLEKEVNGRPRAHLSVRGRDLFSRCYMLVRNTLFQHAHTTTYAHTTTLHVTRCRRRGV